MLEIAKLNSKTSNNSIRLAVATLAISIARLVATTFAILVVATPLKLIALVVLVIAAPLKRNACKVARGRAASGTS
jgi:hypothetical protein